MYTFIVEWVDTELVYVKTILFVCVCVFYIANVFLPYTVHGVKVLSKYSFWGSNINEAKKCAWDFSIQKNLEKTSDGIFLGKAKLCKILTLQRPEKKVLHFSYVTSQKKTTFIPLLSSLFPRFLHWC